MNDALRMVIAKLDGARKSGGQWMARCPAHEDTTASLSITEGKEQPVIFNCKAGCDSAVILDKLGLAWKDLCQPRDEAQAAREDIWTPNGPAIAVYPYHDENGTLLFEVLRSRGKKFCQRVPDQKARSGWSYRLGDTRRVLFHLPKLLDDIASGMPVFVCYADDTEVLTPSGWTLMAKLPGDALVAQYEAGEISFVSPSARQVFDYAGLMVSIDADWSGLLVTPDHRVLCKWRGSSPVTIRAEEVGAARWLPVAGVRAGTGSGPTADEARLLAAWQADGVNCARGHRIAWNLRKARKIDRLRHLLSVLGIEWREQRFPSTPGWTYLTIDRRDAPVLGRLPGKRFGWDILDWPAESRHALLDELGYWDGDRPGREGVRYFTADEQCAEVISAVAATTGWGSIVRRDDRADRPEQGAQWVISLVPRDWRTLGSKPGREDYDGRVYCLTVPSGYLVTRRQGKVTVCGNCEGEKDVLALERAGCTATCNPGGAGKWREEYSEFLRDAIIRIVADRDEPGQRHARQVFASLLGVAACVEIVEAAGEGLPDGRKIKDASDHLEAGHTPADFVVTRQEHDEAPDLAPDLHEFLAVEDEPYDWLIPHVIERGDRLIWTGTEGTGKSVEVRTFAICLAAGLHPFDRAVIKPGRVLFIDCENSERKTRKHFRHLEKIARIKGRRVPDGNLRIICRPEGVDLLSEDGAAWLLERVTAHKPDLLCIGPFYRLHHGDMNDERCARLATVVLDRARVKADCALITEHHAPHGEGPVRSVRPVGSSLLMRWPELGIGIRGAANAERSESGHYMTVDVVMWRGARDDEYRWPRQLTFGSRESEWPWIDVLTQRIRVVPDHQEGTSA